MCLVIVCCRSGGPNILATAFSPLTSFPDVFLMLALPWDGVAPFCCGSGCHENYYVQSTKSNNCVSCHSGKLGLWARCATLLCTCRLHGKWRTILLRSTLGTNFRLYVIYTASQNLPCQLQLILPSSLGKSLEDNYVRMMKSRASVWRTMHFGYKRSDIFGRSLAKIMYVQIQRVANSWYHPSKIYK